MDWKINIGRLCLLLCTVCVEHLWCLDLHVFQQWTRETGPISVFNASTRVPGGVHSGRVLNGSPNSANKVLLLEPHSGRLFVNPENICSLTKNPLQYIITSQHLPVDLNVSFVPLTIYFHDLPCRVPYSKTRNTKSQVEIHLFSSNQELCATRNQSVLSLRTHMPASLIYSTCGITSYHTDFMFDQISFELISKDNQCLKGNTWEIYGELCQCDSSTKVPFLVTISDGGWKPKMEFSAVTKKVGHNGHSRMRRAANTAPFFATASYSVSVHENMTAGVTVTILTATDLDEGSDSMLTYDLMATKDSRSNDMFNIGATSGIVTTAVKLDRETMQEHVFKVTAIDGAVRRETGSTTLTITVLDVNDNNPVFASPIYNVSRSENIPKGTVILTVRATDRDAGDNAEIRYSFTRPTNVFLLDPIGGSISTVTVLDREAQSTYVLGVQATDKAELAKRRSSTATVNIYVTDENDNFPLFTQSSYSVNISEDFDSSQNKVIGRVSATDTDEGKNKDITYEITSGNALSTFTIDPQTGEISIQRDLDYELTTNYQLRIKASDSGIQPKSHSTTFWVRVVDVNDNDPQFQNVPYRTSVFEDISVNSSVLTVWASDADSGINKALTYTIPNPPQALPFTINRDTGIITLYRDLDREMKETYDFVVQVSDKGTPSRSATAGVFISVRDVNDNDPIFLQKSYDIIVSEDHQVNQVIIQVSAKDLDEGDNSLLTYQIVSGNTNQAFRIEARSGNVVLAKALNYKIHNRYILNIRASDIDSQFDTTEVRINVTDINKHRPIFGKASYSLNVFENLEVGASVGSVSASDDDVGENGRITYEITGGMSQFSIDPNNGEIFTREILDREINPAYSFSVKASDNGNPAQSDTTSVIVFVKDKNDNLPVFEKNAYTGSIREDAYDGASVLQVIATDKDEHLNAQLAYRFQLESTDFEIDSATGEIRVAKDSKLDRERQNNYTLIVEAVDGGNPKLSWTVEVKINIQDVNDNAPQFPTETISALVPENTPIGTTVAAIEAVDPDAPGPNSIVEYSFEPGLDVDKFELIKRPGDPAIIVNLIDLDYESDHKIFRVILKASSGTLFSTAEVLIKVQDINDNPPKVNDFTIIFNNFEDHFPTAPIGRIPAHDPDVSDQDRLVYTFLMGNEANYLHLNESTGEITLDPRLNSDVPRNGTIQVHVFDGKHQDTATCHLYVRLVSSEMLHNSVTIRLNNMTTATFLRPVFGFFVDAIASVLHTDKSNVYVISVENDTDVSAQILNVTVSVRQKTIRVDRQQVDVFYPAEYLQEQIYLQRTLLANLSTLQVLPFDDNLCVGEPCSNFRQCLSQLKFGKAAPFISSEAMLFRPIQPKLGYSCPCPIGFTDGDNYDQCDVEVDLCYSNPCNNSGKCIRRESGYTCDCYQGFTGDNCELDISQKFDICPPNVCNPPSTCQVLIEGRFRCEGCPNDEDYNEFCQLTTRNFPRGSFLMFPSLKQRNRLTFQLSFATQEKDGLLFYNGRFNEQHDFIALEIIDGQVQFSFSLGETTKTVSPFIPGGVNDGAWHQVTVSYINRTATVTVGKDCDTEISVRYGQPINYTCAARVTQQLDIKCDKSWVSCYRLLDLTGPLQIGGLPSLPSAFQVQNKDYIGCIKNVYIDGKLLDLNKSITNNGTQPGCSVKHEYCKAAPCFHGGTCMEGWMTYYCLCPDTWGGKDCTLKIDAPQKLDGNSYIYYNQLLMPVRFPWYNGISFRTRNPTGTLMHIIAERGESIFVELVDGYATYKYSNSLSMQTFVLDAVKVNDGQWHNFQVRWDEDLGLVMILDYGQRLKLDKIQSTLENKAIQHVYVGTQRLAAVNSKNFTGCLENIQLGNEENTLLLQPQLFNTQEGCQVVNSCQSGTCGATAECVDEWESHSCKCPPGTMGPNCDNICTTYNPCQNMAHCRHPQGGSYQCQCGVLQSGQYCENTAIQPCPNGWWGYPVCGPCGQNCTRENGFNPICDKATGTCSCRENYYRPQGSNKCLKCDCYGHGSTSLQCDMTTGQCPCINGVRGRRCDQCLSQYAEIRINEDTNEYSCLVDYDSCPRSYAEGNWWDTNKFGVTVVQDCPNNAVGEAVRNCSESGTWEEPDLFNCTNQPFLDLEQKIELIENGELLITTFVAKTTIANLANATYHTTRMFGNDLNITLRILSRMLDYETNQTGLTLTSEQDSRYLSNLISAMSDVFIPAYRKDWQRLSDEPSGGTAGLIAKMEKYLSTLVSALELKSYGSSQPYNVVTENIVLGVDTIKKNNFTGKTIPKYDNIVKTPIFDEDTRIAFPQSSLRQAQLKDFLKLDAVEERAHVGFILFKTLGDLLPHRYSLKVRNIVDRPMSVNSPLFTVLLKDNNSEVTNLTDPVVITFKQLITGKRTSPQCVFWDLGRSSGEWSTNGCTEVDRYILDDDEYVKCSCNHLTSFGILMDISDEEYEETEPVPLEVITFIGLILCMCFLVISFIVMLCFKRLRCNTTSIHTNLIFVIFVSQLAFLVGINKTKEPEKLFCRLIAIALHYSYMGGFAWLFVDILHIYRMLTEIRNIDMGSMKFYYLIGYMVPGIIVSLAVGLNTEGYGSRKFCWLSMSDKFIWSFAGPITLCVIMTIFTFVLAVKASCREKISVTDLSPLRLGLLANIIILMLWGIIWVMGLLSVNFDLQGLHYVFAIFSLFLGVFIFFIFILVNGKVRYELKKLWYTCKGKKLELEENLTSNRNSLSRSALAYHHQSTEGILHRHIGISTNSTTSHSTSKSSGGIYKGEDYLRSTSTSTSGNIPPAKYPQSSNYPPPYGYDPRKVDGLDDPDSMQLHMKAGNDSDSDSEMSEGEASLDLASSHSSDDDDDLDIEVDWEKQLPKNKKIEEAKEQIRLKKKEKDEKDALANRPAPGMNNSPPPLYQSVSQPQVPPLPQSNPHTPGQWPGDPHLSSHTTGSDSEFRSTDQHTLSSIQPDVTLQTPEYRGRVMITPPQRTDSLMNDSNSSNSKGPFSSPFNSPREIESPQDRMKVRVLTHRGSISSDSECSHETSV